MGRNAIRINLLSLDTISIINKLYPNLYNFWLEHLSDADITPVNFYIAMRHNLITKELEDLIESCLEWKLRQLGWDREEANAQLATLLTEDEAVAKITSILEGVMQATCNKDITLLPDIETQSQVLFYLKLRAHLSTQKSSDKGQI